MKKEKLIVEVVVGYMLKVLKNGIPINKFKIEFACIRHGNYDEFIGLIGEEKPFMIVGDIKTGEIRSENLTQKNTCDFGGLLMAGPSLKKFYVECKKEFGNVIDNDISDDIFESLVHFELTLRMHGNNNNLLNEKEELISVIEKVGKFKSLTINEINDLHEGRKFLNMVKHNNHQFKTYSDGILALNNANKILDKYILTIQ